MVTSEVTVTWLGADGTSWNLLDPKSPVQIIGAFAGLHFPESTSRWTSTARIPGRKRRGVVHDGKKVSFRLHVGDLFAPVRVGPEWRDVDARWWQAMPEDAPGVLTVTTARGARSLQLWLDEAPDPMFATDPAIVGSQEYEVTLAAEAYAWSGEELTYPFEYADEGGDDFFGGAAGGGYGPPFVIGGASMFQTAEVSNPGDYDVFPRYKLTAPFGSATIGIGDDLVTLPFGSDVGQEISVDTDPEQLTIVNEAGTNLWPLLGSAPDPLFAAIPPGATVPITIELTAADAGAEVEVSFTPLYRRAIS